MRARTPTTFTSRGDRLAPWGDAENDGSRTPVRRRRRDGNDVRRCLISATAATLILALAIPAGSLGQTESEPDAVNAEAVPTAVVADPPPDAFIPPSAEPAPVAPDIATEPLAPQEPLSLEETELEPVAVAAAEPEPVGLGPELAAPAESTTLVPPQSAVAEPVNEGPELAPPEVAPAPVSAPVVAPGPTLGAIPATTAAPAAAPPAVEQAPVAPSGGQSAVIAQGLVDFALEEVVWRTVRYQADTTDEPTFVERPLGFVVALDDPLLLVDQASGERTQLAPREAAIVRAGVAQQRTSQTAALVPYLAIELAPAVTAQEAPNGEVLHVSEPFLPSPGGHTLVLARHVLPPGRILSVPDSGERNLLVVIEGAVVSQPPGGQAPETLLAGESTVFRGAWEIALAETSGNDATIVIASIGAI